MRMMMHHRRCQTERSPLKYRRVAINNAPQVPGRAPPTVIHAVIPKWQSFSAPPILSMVRRSLLEQGDGERAAMADCILIGRTTRHAIGTVIVDIAIYLP